MGDAVGSKITGGQLSGFGAKVTVPGGEPDHVTYVIKSSWRVPATM